MGSSETLRSVIDVGATTKRLDELSTARVIGQIAEQLHAAQQKAGAGKAIGPIAPVGIVIETSGAAKLGLESITSPPAGATAYSAPEQLAGNADRRSDVFSLGIVMWEALTHQRLFDAHDDASIRIAVANRTVTPPSELNANIPAELGAICMKALARNPADRYQSAKVMAAEIEAVLEEAGYPDNDSKIAEYMAAFGQPPRQSKVTLPPIGIVVTPATGVPPPPIAVVPEHRVVDTIPNATTVDPTAPPFGGAAGQASPAVDPTAPPFGGAAGQASPAVDPTAPPFGGAAGQASPAVDPTAPPFGGAAGQASPAVDPTAPPFGGAAGQASPAVDPTAPPFGGAAGQASPAVESAPVNAPSILDRPPTEPPASMTAPSPGSMSVPPKPAATILPEPESAIEPSASATLPTVSPSTTLPGIAAPTATLPAAISSPTVHGFAAAAAFAAVPTPPTEPSTVAPPKLPEVAPPKLPEVAPPKLPEVAPPKLPEPHRRQREQDAAASPKLPEAVRLKLPELPPGATKDESPASVAAAPTAAVPPVAASPVAVVAAPVVAAAEASSNTPHPASVVALPAPGAKAGRESQEVLGGWGWGTDSHAVIPQYEDPDDELVHDSSRKTLLYVIGGGVGVALVITIIALGFGGSGKPKKPTPAPVAAMTEGSAAVEVAPPPAPAPSGSDLAGSAMSGSDSGGSAVSGSDSGSAVASAAGSGFAAGSGTGSSAPVIADVPKPDVPKPDLAPKPDVPKPDVPKPDVPKPDKIAVAPVKPVPPPKPEKIAKAEPSKPKPEKPHPEPARLPDARPNAEASYKVGLQQFVRGDTAGALASLRTSLAGNPNYAPTWRGLGLVFEKMGEKDQARAAFKRYLQLAPSAGDADQIRNRLERLGS